MTPATPKIRPYGMTIQKSCSMAWPACWSRTTSCQCQEEGLICCIDHGVYIVASPDSGHTMHELDPCKDPKCTDAKRAAHLHSWQTFVRHIAGADHGLGRCPPSRSIAERVVVGHGAAQASRGLCCRLNRRGSSLRPEISAPCARQAPARRCASGYSWQRRSKAHTKMSDCQSLYYSDDQQFVTPTELRDSICRMSP